MSRRGHRAVSSAIESVIRRLWGARRGISRRIAHRGVRVEALETRQLLSTLYYDTSDSPGLQAGDGTWSTSVTNWNPAADGSGTRVAWTDGSDAVFSASGSSIVTITDSVSAQTLSMTGSGYQLSGGALMVADSGVFRADVTLSNVTMSGSTYPGFEAVNGVTIHVSGDVILNASMTIDSGATLELPNASSLSTGGDGSLFNQGTLEGNGGSLTVDGSVNAFQNNGTINWGGGNPSVVGSAMFWNQGVMNWSAGTLSNNDWNNEINNYGTINWNGGTLVIGGWMNQGGTLILAPNCIADWQNAGWIRWWTTDLSALGNFVNTGIIEFDVDLNLSDLTLANTGDYEVGAGVTMQVSGDLSIGPGAVLQNWGTLNWSGDSLAISGGGSLLNAGALNLSGNEARVSGAGGAYLGAVNWTGSSLIVADQVNLDMLNWSGGTLLVENGGELTLGAATGSSLDWQNDGTIRWQSADLSLVPQINNTGTIIFEAGAADLSGLTLSSGVYQIYSWPSAELNGHLNIESGATLDVPANRSLVIGSSGVLDNSGTMYVNDGSLTIGAGGVLNNDGVIHWQSSDTSLLPQITNNGTIVFDTDTDLSGLTLNSGTYQIGSGVNAQLTGNLSIDGGATLEAADQSSLTIGSGGRLDNYYGFLNWGAASLTISGGGLLYNRAGSGAVNLSGGSLTIGGSLYNEATLNGDGTDLVINSGAIDSWNGMINWIGGNSAISGGGDLNNWMGTVDWSGGTLAITDSGTLWSFDLGWGGGTVTFDTVDVTISGFGSVGNEGTMDWTGGDLAISGGGWLTNGNMAATTLNWNGGIWTISDGGLFENLRGTVSWNAGDMIISGTGYFINHADWGGSIVNWSGGNLTVTDGGSLDNSDTLTWSGGDIWLENGGAFTGDGSYARSVGAGLLHWVNSTTSYWTASGATVEASEGSEFTGILASFITPNPFATAGDYTVSIDWQDGSPTSSGTIVNAIEPGYLFAIQASHTYADNGIYHPVITLTGTGAVADAGTALPTITINNLAPTATLTNSGPVDEGSTATVTFSNQFDPSAADTSAGFHYSYALTSEGLAANYAAATDIASKNFRFPQSGTYTIHSRIFDKDGAYTDYTTEVTVEALAVVLTGNDTIDEGSSYALQLSASHADAVLRWIIQWGDGQASAYSSAELASAGWQVEHVYADGSGSGTERTISVDVVTGISLITNTAGKTISVLNVAPTASFTSDSPITAGSQVIVRFDDRLSSTYVHPTDPSVSDRSAGFRYSYALDPQDLATSYEEAQDAIESSFSFADAGVYDVYGRIFDRDGGYRDYSVPVLVNSALGEAQIFGPDTCVEGDSASFAVTTSLAGSPSYTWSALRGEEQLDLTGIDTHSATFDFAPGAEGDFQVLVEVQIGGQTLYAHHSLRAIPAAPTDLAVVSSGQQHVLLTWTNNSDWETEFVLERSETADFAQSITFVLSPAASYDDMAVLPGRTYYYRVRARGESYSSSDSNVVNGLTAPAQISDLIVVAVTDVQVDLDWSAVAGAAQYVVQMRVPGGAWTDASTALSTTEASITGLEDGISYRFRVRATGTAGESYSNEVSVLTVFKAPTGLAVDAAVTTSYQVGLNWQINPSSPDRLVLERASDDEFTQGVRTFVLSGDLTAYLDTTVLPSSTYFYRIAAGRGSVVSDYGALCPVTTPADLLEPRQLRAVLVTPYHVDLNWSSVSSLVDVFHVEHSLDGVSFDDLTPDGWDTITFPVDGLLPESTYYFRVRGVRSDTSEFTGYSPVLTVATPAEPHVGSGLGLSGSYYATPDFSGDPVTQVDAQIDFDWNTEPPSAVGEATTYSVAWTGQILAQYDGAHTFYVQASGAIRLWINGELIVDAWTDQPDAEYLGHISLAAGQRYDIRLEYLQEAESSALKLLWSSPSLPKQVISQAQLFDMVAAPAAPSELQAIANPDCVDLTWIDNADNENGFVLERADDTAFTQGSVSVSLGVNSQSYRDSDVVEGAHYYYRVRSMNSAGSSSNTSPLEVIVPLAAPSGLVVQSVSETSVDLSWAGNSQGAIGFHVRVRDDVAWTVLPELIAAEQWTVTGLTAGKRYTFQVQAVSETAESAYSAEVLATTLLVAPANLYAESIYSTRATLAWDAVAGADGYVLEQFQAGDWLTVLGVWDGTTGAVVTDLAPDTSYSYRVRSINAGGYSAPSAALDIQTPAAGLVVDAGGDQSISEADSIALSGSVIDASAAGTLTYSWEIRDAGDTVVCSGSTQAIEFEPLNSGSYTAIFTATDGAISAFDTLLITVANVTPSVSIAAAETNVYVIGSSLSFLSTVQDAAAQDTISYLWSVLRGGQPIASLTTSQMTFVPTIAGDYVVELVVTDDDGASSGVASLSMSVADPGASQLFTVTDLALVNDTGAPGDDVTGDSRIQGRVAGSAGQFAPVEYDLNGDGMAEGFVVAGADGTFIADVSSFVSAAGPVTVRFRAGRQDPTTGEYIYGSWTSFSYYYSPSESPAQGPTSHIPGESSTAGFSDPSVVPVITADDGRSATDYRGGPLYPGAPTAFSSRFDPTGGASFSVNETDLDDTPATVVSGGRTISTSGTSQHIIESVVNPEGSWTYHETLISTYLIDTLFSGGNGVTWHLVQSGGETYTFDAYGDNDFASYSIYRLWTQEFSYDWPALGLGDHTYHSQGSESFLLTGGGTQTTTPEGTSIGEDLAYIAWGESSYVHDGKGTDGDTEWTDHNELSSHWRQFIRTERSVETSGAQTIVVTHDYNSKVLTDDKSHRFQVIDETLTAGGVTTTTTGSNTDDTDADGSTELFAYGQMIYHPDGQVTGFTRVNSTRNDKDKLDQEKHLNVVTVDKSSSGITQNSSANSNFILHREREYYNRNEALTIFEDAQTIVFHLDTDGFSETKANWSSDTTTHADSKDTSAAGTTRTYVSDRYNLDHGNSFYRFTSKGTRSSGYGLSKVTGTSKSVQQTSGNTQWNYLESTTLDSVITTGSSSAVLTTTTSTGGSTTTDHGNGKYNSYAEGTMTSDEDKGTSKSGFSNHHAVSDSSTSDISDYTTDVLTTDKSLSGVTRTVTSYAHVKDGSKADIHATSDGSAIYTDSSTSSTETIHRDENGETDVFNEATDTTEVLNTNKTGTIANSSITNFQLDKQHGNYSATNISTTTVTNNTTSWDESGSWSSSGDTYLKQSTDTDSHVVDVSTKDLSSTTYTNTSYERVNTGTYQADGSTQSSGVGSGYSSTSKSGREDEGTYTVTSRSYKQYDSTDNRKAIKLYSYYDITEDYNGGGSFWATSSTSESADSSGFHQYQTQSDSGDDGSGTNTVSSYSYTTGKGTEQIAPGVTCTVDSKDEYRVRDQQGTYESWDKSHFESKTQAGAIISSSWSESYYQDSGQSPYAQTTDNTTSNSDTSKSGVTKSDKNVTHFESGGTGNYWREYHNRNDSYEDGTWSYFSDTDERDWGDWNNNSSVITESYFKDTTQRGVTKYSDSYTETRQNDSGYRWSTNKSSSDGNADGTSTSVEESNSGSHTDGVLEKSLTHSKTTVERSILTQNGTYSYQDASDNTVTAPIYRFISGSEQTTTDREGSGSYTIDITDGSFTEDGTTTSSSSSVRYESGTFDSTTVDWSSGTITDSCDGMMFRTAATDSVETRQTNDGSYNSETGTWTDVDADNKTTRTDWSKYDERGEFTSTTGFTENGRAWEVTSLKTGAKRITSKDYTNNTSNDSGSYWSHDESLTKLAADGSSTSYSKQEQSSNGTTSSHAEREVKLSSTDKVTESGQEFTKDSQSESRSVTDITGGTWSWWSWNQSDNLAGGPTITVGDSIESWNYPYTFSSHTADRTTMSAGSSEVRTSESTHDITDGEGNDSGNATTHTAGSVVGVTSRSDSTSGGKYMDDSKSSYVLTVNSGGVSGSSSSSSTDHTTGSFYSEDHAQSSDDGAGMWWSANWQSYTDNGSNSWSRKSSKFGTETSTVDGGSVAKTENNHSEESGTDNFGGTTITTQTAGSGQQSSSLTDDRPAASTGTFNWNTWTSAVSVATKDKTTNVTTDTTSDAGNGRYSSTYDAKSNKRTNESHSSGRSSVVHMYTADVENAVQNVSGGGEPYYYPGTVTLWSGKREGTSTTDDYSIDGCVTITQKSNASPQYTGSVTRTDHTVTEVTSYQVSKEEYVYTYNPVEGWRVDGDRYRELSSGDRTRTESTVTETVDAADSSTSKDSKVRVEQTKDYCLDSTDTQENTLPEAYAYLAALGTTFEETHHSRSSLGTWSTTENGLPTGSGTVLDEVDEHNDPSSLFSALGSGELQFPYYYLKNHRVETDASTGVGTTTSSWRSTSTSRGVLFDGNGDPTGETWSSWETTTGTGEATQQTPSSGWRPTKWVEDVVRGTTLYEPYLWHQHTVLTAYSGQFSDGDLVLYRTTDWIDWYGSGHTEGPYPLYLSPILGPWNIYHGDVTDQLIDWVYDTTGINIPAVTDSAIDGVQTFADGFFGTVDSFLNTINPLDRWWSIPDIGPVYGHTTAYGVGQVVGTVAGVAASIAVGNAAAGACGTVALGAKVYNTVDAAAGIVGATQNIVQNGSVGVGDALAFVPALTFGAQRLRGVQNQCFVEGTEVLSGSSDQPGVFSETEIEDLEVGDLVWTRSSDDPDAPLELKPVTALYRHVVYDLQQLSVQDENGNVEVLSVTDEHPFYTSDRGWTDAEDLYVGEYVVDENGRRLTIIGNADDYRPDGVVVYNFEVEGDHTYFVADGQGDESFVWVHNTCAGLNHLFPVALGNPIPRGNKEFLTFLNSAEHTAFHEGLNKHLNGITKTIAGKTYTMMPKAFQSGEVIQSIFSLAERRRAVESFVSTFRGGKYRTALANEIIEALKRGMT